MEKIKFGKNYQMILIVLLSLFIGIFIIGSVYLLFISKNKLVQIPLLDNTYIVKNSQPEDSEEMLFEKYLLLMNKKGYIYLPDDRMGAILHFKKNNEKIIVPYPKFIKISHGNVEHEISSKD
jgi:hypothetical protein